LPQGKLHNRCHKIPLLVYKKSAAAYVTITN
jgi:hypothetical protein